LAWLDPGACYAAKPITSYHALAGRTAARVAPEHPLAVEVVCSLDVSRSLA